MKKIHLCFIILFVFSSSIAQTNSEIKCWESSTDYINLITNKVYKLEIKKDSIRINIIAGDHNYSYNYKLFKRKLFFLDGDKYFINYENDKIRIKYFETKKRISVNEITTLEFRKCP